MKKRWKQIFNNLKLAEKMMLVYVILIGVCFGIAIGALQVSLNIYDKKLYEKSLQELDFFIQRVNDSLGDVENLSYTIAMSTENQEGISESIWTPV